MHVGMKESMDPGSVFTSPNGSSKCDSCCRSSSTTFINEGEKSSTTWTPVFPLFLPGLLVSKSLRVLLLFSQNAFALASKVSKAVELGEMMPAVDTNVFKTIKLSV